jgi:DoxX-like family
MEKLGAIGLAMVMVGAANVTLRRHEFKHMLVNLTYLALAVFVAWGRLPWW